MLSQPEGGLEEALGATAHLRNGLHVLGDQASLFPAMIPFQVARELGIDVERRLYADNHITRLVCDPSNCENVLLVFRAVPHANPQCLRHGTTRTCQWPSAASRSSIRRGGGPGPGGGQLAGEGYSGCWHTTGGAHDRVTGGVNSHVPASAGVRMPGKGEVAICCQGCCGCCLGVGGAFGRREVEVSRALKKNDIVRGRRGQTHGDQAKDISRRRGPSRLRKWVSFFSCRLARLAEVGSELITASDVLSNIYRIRSERPAKKKRPGFGCVCCEWWAVGWWNGNSSASSNNFSRQQVQVLMSRSDCVIAVSAVGAWLEHWRLQLGAAGANSGRATACPRPASRGRFAKHPRISRPPHDSTIWGEDPSRLYPTGLANGVYCINTENWGAPRPSTRGARSGPEALQRST